MKTSCRALKSLQVPGPNQSEKRDKKRSLAENKAVAYFYFSDSLIPSNFGVVINAVPGGCIHRLQCVCVCVCVCLLLTAPVVCALTWMG